MTGFTRSQWKQMAAELALPNRAFINGRSVDALSGERFETINPATGEVLAEVASCQAEDVDVAVSAARKAFESGVWAGRAPAERKKTMLALAQLIRDHLAEFALLESLDMGKPVNDAYTMDVPNAAGVLQWYAEAIDKVYDEIAPTGLGDLALIRREALGVVGAVVPWNFPLEMAVWKIAPALATGNSIVLKPAEQSPLSAIRLAELAAEAGIPDGVLNVLPGLGETAGQAIGLHHDIDCVAFTGSTEVGKLFLGYSARSNMKQVWLECGGKSPNIVFADCPDLDAAADMAAFGIFFNQGEVCSANSRLLVEKSIKDAFMEKLLVRVRAIRPGDPLDPQCRMGAMVDRSHTDRVMGYIEAGRKSARLVHGGERIVLDRSDCFVMPTVFDQVSNDMTIARDEIFGPVLAVIEFEGEEEAVSIANDTIYGLAASVWTEGLSRAHRVAGRLRAGTVTVNGVDAGSPMTPFGGFRQSGIGRDLSLHSLDKYTALKTTWIKYRA